VEGFLEAVGAVSAWLWGPPVIIILAGTGIYLTLLLKFVQFRYPVYIFQQTLGSIFKKPKGEGTVTPLQALTSALSATIGAANIVGVPAAIMFGGPGALFWMWVIALMGMALKFSESVLAVRYREKNEKGEFVGGPMYYMKNGLNMKWLGVWFAFALMIELIPSIMVQGNAVASTVQESFEVDGLYTGIAIAVIVSLIVFGGIKRIGKVTEKLVPFMAILYVGTCLVILFMNIEKLPNVLNLVFSHAFQPMSAIGGFAGVAVAETVRWGFARGLYSNEAGLGTAPIAHAAATTDHPVRQGLWSIIGIVIDTLIVCTATGFVVISSGVWTAEGALDNPSALTTQAFGSYLGSTGSLIVTISLIFFVLSTIVVIIYYGAKQAEFLFGLKAALMIKFVYIAAIILGSVGAAQVIWQFLDLALVAILIPNILAVLLLSKEVRRLTQEFFTSDKYYLKDIGKK
jgi:alanine or glycine:cation symporter, AGCS family